MATLSMPGATSAVHPHVRGDNAALLTSARISRGSPPRAGGQLCPSRLRHSAVRFTPTCVGTIISACHRPILSAVHPHVRGDNALSSPALIIAAGSPPRAWGQLTRPTPIELRIRFTPTCVGTIERHSSYGRCETVHPHVRGDNALSSPALIIAAGSPPRAWGQWVRKMVRFLCSV